MISVNGGNLYPYQMRSPNRPIQNDLEEGFQIQQSPFKHNMPSFTEVDPRDSRMGSFCSIGSSVGSGSAAYGGLSTDGQEIYQPQMDDEQSSRYMASSSNTIPQQNAEENMDAYVEYLESELDWIINSPIPKSNFSIPGTTNNSSPSYPLAVEKTTMETSFDPMGESASILIEPSLDRTTYMLKAETTVGNPKKSTTLERISTIATGARSHSPPKTNYGGGIKIGNKVYKKSSNSNSSNSLHQRTLGDFANVSSPYLEHLRPHTSGQILDSKRKNIFGNLPTADSLNATNTLSYSPTKSFYVVPSDHQQPPLINPKQVHRQAWGSNSNLKDIQDDFHTKTHLNIDKEYPIPVQTTVNTKRTTTAPYKLVTTMPRDKLGVSTTEPSPSNNDSELYFRNQVLRQHLTPSRSTARMYLSASKTNEMQFHPVSAELQCPTLQSPPATTGNGITNTNRLGLSGIDALLSQPSFLSQTGKLRSDSAKGKRLNMLSKIDHKSSNAISNVLASTEVYTENTSSQTDDDVKRTQAVEMLANLHVDPLYRIIRDEVERLGGLQATNVLKNKSNLELLSTSLSAADFKVLVRFKVLPPAVWVSCRLVYYVILSFYECCIQPPSMAPFRRASGLEKLWKILDEHVSRDGMCVEKLSRLFTWQYLQSLMKYPVKFCRLLELIESGIPNDKLDSLTEMQTDVEDALYKFRKLHSLDVLGLKTAPSGSLVDNLEDDRYEMEVEDEERDVVSTLSYDAIKEYSTLRLLQRVVDSPSSCALFFDQFPFEQFSTLRELVRSARSFLLTTSGMMVSGTGSDGPTIPGSTLSIATSLTSWVKHVIAMLFLSGTRRARNAQANVLPVISVQGLLKTPSEYQPRSTSHSTSMTLTSPPGVSFLIAVGADETGMCGCPGSSVFTAAMSLVKPNDNVELLITTRNLIEDHYNAGEIAASFNPEINRTVQGYLRRWNSSPLHRAMEITSPHDFPLLPAVSSWDLSVVLKYCFSRVLESTLSGSHGEPQCNNNGVEILALPYPFGGELPTSPDRNPRHASYPSVPEPLSVKEIHLEEEKDFNVMSQCLQFLSFSLCLLRPKLSIIEQTSTWQAVQNLSPSLPTAALLETTRYVISVTDTEQSWQAFQLACRIAKENDIIIITHTPIIDLSDLLQMPGRLRDGIQYEPSMKYQPINALTHDQYNYLVSQAMNRQERVVATYRSLGYNVSCGEIISFSEAAKLVLETYSATLRYNRRVFMCSDSLYSGVTLGMQYFLQYNEFQRLLAKKLLENATKFNCDVLVFGTYPRDIVHAVTCNYSRSYWDFRPMSSTAMTLDEYPYNIRTQGDVNERKSSLTATENIDLQNEDDPAEFAMTANTFSNTKFDDDYDADSFIIDDEGEDSLTNSLYTTSYKSFNPTNHVNDFLLPQEINTIDSSIVHNIPHLNDYLLYASRAASVADFILYFSRQAALNNNEQWNDDPLPTFSLLLANNSSPLH